VTKIKPEKCWLLPNKGFIIHDIIRRELLFAENEKEVKLFFKSVKRNKEEYTITPVDFSIQDFSDDIIHGCSDGMLAFCYGKAITPAEEEEFARYIDDLPEEYYHNLYSLISGIEKLVLTKEEKEFTINTIHRLFGFVGCVNEEISNAIEYHEEYITGLNLSRVLDRVLERENSKEMRSEYYNAFWTGG
jgi:hypothetical protein